MLYAIITRPHCEFVLLTSSYLRLDSTKNMIRVHKAEDLGILYRILAMNDTLKLLDQGRESASGSHTSLMLFHHTFLLLTCTHSLKSY